MFENTKTCFDIKLSDRVSDALLLNISHIFVSRGKLLRLI